MCHIIGLTTLHRAQQPQDSQLWDSPQALFHLPVLLDILQRWGQVSFHPHPADVIHFDVIFSLLHELRRRKGPMQLVKVKRHTVCLLNERADEWAERGFHAEPPDICPGSVTVWLGV